MCCFCAAGKPEKPRKMYSTKLFTFSEEAVRRRNGSQVAFGAQARQQPGLGRGRGQPRQRRGQSGLRGGTRSRGRGTRGHPVGARQVGRAAPQAVPTRRQLSVQYHVG